MAVGSRAARLAAEERGGLQYVIAERRICWPNPDATDLNGGCGWCNDGEWVTLARIERYARRISLTGRELPHRGIGSEDAWHAYQYGLEHEFFNAETRASREALVEFAETVPMEALRKMAEGMRGWREAKRPVLMAWMLRHRRMVLDDSFRISAQGRLR